MTDECLMTNDERNPNAEGKAEDPSGNATIRRRDRIILFLIGVVAVGTLVFAILQFVTMKRN